MVLALDTVTIGVPDVQNAHAFYEALLAPSATDHHQYVHLDLHSAGQVALYDIEALAQDAGTHSTYSGFRGYTLSCIVSQPSEVSALVDRAARNGATVLKPAKKSMWGGFSGVVQAPDGAIWKFAADAKKDAGPVDDPPVPAETTILLGVADPKTTKRFYEHIGLVVNKDYGSKYVDFDATGGASRLGLHARRALAKDAGVNPDGSGFRAVVLNRVAADRDEVDSILAAARNAGGREAKPAAAAEWGGYSGHFEDPDGFLWKVVCQ